MSKQDDSFFLLEVLIDKLSFTKSPCFSDKDFRTCISFDFMSVEPLEICDDESTNCTKGGGPFVKYYNSGKSCLFVLKEGEIKQATSKFPIKTTVYKSLPCGCLPTKIVIGECTIDMTKEFVQARKKFLESPGSVCYQALKDTFRITAPDGTQAGDIVLFLRISCLGKNIVTRFQGTGAGGPLPMMDGGAGAGAGKPRKDGPNAQDPCRCGAQNSGGMAGQAFGPGDAEESWQPTPDPMACRNTEQYCLHVPKGPSKQFEEIGTNLNGNELKIKVPANASIIKKLSQTHCTMQSPYSKGSKNSGPCEPPCAKNQISLALPSVNGSNEFAPLQGTQFTCTSEGCTQASKHWQAAKSPGGGDRPNEQVNRDMFVLKVAKTAMQANRKCKLELELVTPKGPDKRPPVDKSNVRVQCIPVCDCCLGSCGKIKGRKRR